MNELLEPDEVPLNHITSPVPAPMWSLIVSSGREDHVDTCSEAIKEDYDKPTGASLSVQLQTITSEGCHSQMMQSLSYGQDSRPHPLSLIEGTYRSPVPTIPNLVHPYPREVS